MKYNTFYIFPWAHINLKRNKRHLMNALNKRDATWKEFLSHRFNWSVFSLLYRYSYHVTQYTSNAKHMLYATSLIMGLFDFGIYKILKTAQCFFTPSAFYKIICCHSLQSTVNFYYMIDFLKKFNTACYADAYICDTLAYSGGVLNYGKLP